MNGTWIRACRIYSVLLIGSLGCFRASPQSQDTAKSAIAAPAALVLRGMTVVDVTTGHRLPAQTIVIAGTHVRAVGAERAIRVPSGARVIDARGKYLIPGLWDMHAHVEDFQSRWYPIFIANGVTGLRELAQRFPFGADSFRVWQRAVAAGTRVGPRVVGPSADIQAQLQVHTVDEARHVIDSLKAAGDAFLKLHDEFMRPALFFAIAAEARRVGLPFVGHVPQGVTVTEAVDSGQRSIEHVNENKGCLENPEFLLDTFPEPFTERRCAPAAAAYVRNGAWMVPTLVTYYGGYIGDAQQFVRMMHRMGVQVLAGTDVGLPWLLPGFSLHEELELLVGAGLTPLEALQTATLNPAKFFHATDSLGTIAPGKLADLVLLTADPLADIRNTVRIAGVVANGRYFDRAALDTLLAGQPSIVAAWAEVEAVRREEKSPLTYLGYRRRPALPLQKRCIAIR